MQRLCALSDIEDPGSAAFDVDGPGGKVEVLVVRLGERAFGYVNSCPHTGGPLDWLPGRFLDAEQRYIQCATHDALFEIEDGRCVHGPCAGDRLQPVRLRCRAGELWLEV